MKIDSDSQNFMLIRVADKPKDLNRLICDLLNYNKICDLPYDLSFNLASESD